jgi:uncharacterized membrane protein YhaH (DUF805 family)
MIDVTIQVSESATYGGRRVEPGAGPMVMLYFLILFIPDLALSVRRLHDIDKRGWWILLSLVPFGGLVLLFWSVSEGTSGFNRFGAPRIDRGLVPDATVPSADTSG